MEPMTAAALRQALADLPDDAVVTDTTGRPLVEAEVDPTGAVELAFAHTRPRRRSVTNTFVGDLHGGSLMQIGDIRL